MMAFSTLFDPTIANPGYVSYVATASQDTFAIPFDYPQKAKMTDGDISKFIIVRVLEKDEPFTLQASGTELVLDTPALLDDEIEIFRGSDIAELLSFTKAPSLISKENMQDYEDQIQDLMAEQLQRVRWLENERLNATTELQDVLDAAALLVDFRVRIDQITLDLAAAGADVDVSSPVDGQVLIRQGTSFQNKTMSNVLMSAGGVLSIDAGAILAPMIQDSSVTTFIITNQSATIVKFAPGVLVNNPLIFIRHNIPDVVITLPEAAGEVLVYNATATDWLNLPVSGDATGFDASGNTQISPGVIVNSMLQDDVVGPGDIIPGSVFGDHFVDASVTAAKISGVVVDTPEFQDGAIIGFFDLATAAILTQHLQDDAATNQKFAGTDIESSKFDNQAITGSHIVTDELNGVLTTNLAISIQTSMDFLFRMGQSILVAGDMFGRYETTPLGLNMFRVFPFTPVSNYTMSAAGLFTFTTGSVDMDTDLSVFILRKVANELGTKLGGIDLAGTEIDDFSDTAIGRAANAGVSELDFLQTTTQVGGRSSSNATRVVLRELPIDDGETWSLRISIIGRDIDGSDVYANVFHGWISREGATPTIDIIEDADYPKLDPSWDTDPLIDLNGTNFRVQSGGHGTPNTTIRWTSTIRMTKVQQ